MPKPIVNKVKKNYIDIANAIRKKKGTHNKMTAAEMPGEINSIQTGINPTGTLNINANGTYDVKVKANVAVDVPVPEGYIQPEGTKEIRANGEYNIREFENVNIDIPGATTKELFEATENGTYDIAEYANVKVDVPIPPEYVIPEGKIEITENGNNIDVAGKAAVDVNVPVGVFPEGSLDITANANNIDVTNKVSVNVNVPNPSTGTLEITENGNYDVTEKAGVNVNVAGLVPTGNKDITSTEQVNVAEFATAQVVEANLLAANIKKDVSILGIVGTHEGYPEPSGKAPTITENGTNINIKDYASVDVNVPIPAGYIIPEGSLDITENGTNIDVANKATVNVNVPSGGGVTPTGNINITDTNQTNVAAYATAQVVDANLIATNIKKDVVILGITGTFEDDDAIDSLMQETF